MNQSIFIIGVSLFYCSLLAGAILRVRILKTKYAYMQLYGILLPIISALVIALGGKNISSSLFTAMLTLYALTWLCMSTGYLLEALNLRKQKSN